MAIVFLQYPPGLRGASARLEVYIKSSSGGDPLDQTSTIILSSLDIKIPSAPLDHSTAKGLLRPCGQYLPGQEEGRRPWALDRSLFSTGQLVNPFGYPAMYRELEDRP